MHGFLIMCVSLQLEEQIDIEEEVAVGLDSDSEVRCDFRLLRCLI